MLHCVQHDECYVMNSRITRAIKSSRAIKLEIKQGGKTVGRIYLYVIKNDLHKRPYGLLEDLFVDERMRGQGIGTMLVNAAIAEAKKRKLYKLVGTSRTQRARLHEFYKRIGFKKHGLEFRMDLE